MDNILVECGRNGGEWIICEPILDEMDDGKLNNNNGVGSVSATRGLHNFQGVCFCQYTPPPDCFTLILPIPATSCT